MIFAYPIGDYAHEQGSFALNSWGSAGVGFNDVAVTRLGEEVARAPFLAARFWQAGSDAPARAGMVAALVGTDPLVEIGGRSDALVEQTGGWNALKTVEVTEGMSIPPPRPHGFRQFCREPDRCPPQRPISTCWCSAASAALCPADRATTSCAGWRAAMARIRCGSRAGLG